MIVGKNTTFGIGDDPDTKEFRIVAKILSIGEISASRDSIDTTTFDSPDDYRTFAPNKLKDPGEFSLELIWDTSDEKQKELINDVNSELIKTFQIVFPDSLSTTYTFNGFVTGYTIGTPIDDKSTISVSFKLSGKPKWSETIK